MKTRALATGLGLALTASLFGSASALAATRCVGHGAGCHRTLQAALDASRDGDTIKVSAGTFAGGVTITKSVSVVGAGRRGDDDQGRRARWSRSARRATRRRRS